MDINSIFKVWGERRRLLLTIESEIDLLYLKKGGFSSTHTHINKINHFTVIKGKLKIETAFGNKILSKNQTFEVRPPLQHRFVALTNSVVVEIAYVEKGEINPDDIQRTSQGGLIINGEEYTADQLKEKLE